MRDELEAERGLGRDEYNRFVQDAQATAMAFGLKHRTVPTHHDDGRIDGAVEVFWGDGWVKIASETRAMTLAAERTIYPSAWARVKYQAAGELAKS